ncbi:MAG: hypothetical protein MJ002_01360 [Paludibacteraceae bacterium]|nr:hypothetical protein [Paludibacteraceae bacterium]
MRDYTFDRMPISSISGKLSRKSDVYYRTINGKTYAYLLWNPNTNPPTLGTLRTRQIFKTASLYTSLDLKLPFKRKEWEQRMHEHNRLALRLNPDFARHPENYNKHNDPQHLRPYTSVRYFILASYTRALKTLTTNHPQFSITEKNRPRLSTEIITLFIRLNIFTDRLAFDGQQPTYFAQPPDHCPSENSNFLPSNTCASKTSANLIKPLLRTTCQT